MRAVQVVAPGRAEMIESAPPRVREGHALIKVLSLSLCGSDIRMLHYAPRHQYPFPPGTTGHEMVGRIEELAGPVEGLSVGETALVLVDGHRAMADYYLAPVSKVLPLRFDRPAEHLLQAQQLGTVIFACKRIGNIVGKRVAVIGQGSAGLWFNFMLKRMGARQVVALDLLPHRLAVSGHFGASDTILNSADDAEAALAAATGDRLADLVVEAAGTEEAFHLAYRLVRREGEILYFGVPRFEGTLVDYEYLYWKYPTIKTICEAQREPGQESTRMALEMIGRGEIDVSPMLTHRFPFEEVLEAYALHHEAGDGCIKIVIQVSQ